MRPNEHHLPYNRNLVECAQKLRQNMTKAERKLWYDYLKTFPFRVHPQRPIDNFIVDFYCPSLKLVIEVDGESHGNQEAQDHDRERTQVLAQYGISVIRFTNEEVLKNFEGVCSKIEDEIPHS